MDKVSSYFSTYNIISKDKAKMHLEKLIQNSNYFKNNIN